MNFAAALEKFGSRPALILPGEGSISYIRLAEDCDNFAAGLPKGKQLLLVEMSNDYPSIVAYLAGLRRGDAVMLLHAGLNPQLKGQLISAYQPDLVWRKGKNGYQLHRAASDGKTPLHDKLTLLLSTSGSTGSPKCVRLTQENLASNASAIATYLRLDESERAITLLPLHYSYGLSVLNSHLAVGASIVVQRQSVVDKGFWKTLREEKVTSISGVPFIYETLARLRFAGLQLPELRYLTQAGGRLAPALVEEFARLCQKRTWQFYVMYGQTEATARISFLMPEKALMKPDSIGSAIPGGRLWLRGEDGKEVKQAGQPGELVYSGPNVMLGYAARRADLGRGDEAQGILATGDIAQYDADGDLYIVGRKKRFIKLFGQRFGLDEIESQLRIQGVTAACGGRDDCLEIVVEGRHDLERLRRRVADGYRVHSKAIRIASLSVLPKTSSGKIDYATLFAGECNG
ncbi:MAG: AMP-binding protein [Deltaproteobacteria bacterium]